MKEELNITVMILTYNEEPNIERVMSRLTWAPRVLVIDSFSTDKTLSIVGNYSNTEVVQRPFDTFANQCNFGLTQINTEWVLSLDADYVLTESFIEEVSGFISNEGTDAYRVPLQYCIFGKPLRGTLLPPRTMLYRKKKAKYIDDGHAHRVQVQGTVISTNASVYHDDRKSFTRWLGNQDRYLSIEANKIISTPRSALSLSDKIRSYVVISPFLVLVYVLIVKGCLLDGRSGLYYAFQRMIAELILSAKIIEKKLGI